MILATAFLLASCSESPATPISAYPTYNPFVQDNQTPVGAGGAASPSLPLRRGPTPTLASISITFPTAAQGAPLVTPTPDAPRTLPTPRQSGSNYVVQPGDTLGAIAQDYGVSVEALLDANGLTQ